MKESDVGEIMKLLNEQTTHSWCHSTKKKAGEFVASLPGARAQLILKEASPMIVLWGHDYTKLRDGLRDKIETLQKAVGNREVKIEVPNTSPKGEEAVCLRIEVPMVGENWLVNKKMITSMANKVYDMLVQILDVPQRVVANDGRNSEMPINDYAGKNITNAEGRLGGEDPFAELGVEFCPDKGLSVKEMAKFIAKKVFATEEGKVVSLLEERYRQLRNLFADTPFNSSDWSLELEGSTFENVADSKRDARLKIPVDILNMGFDEMVVQEFSKHGNFGHDMPVWMQKKSQEPCNKCIMIVGQDPLRKNDDAGYLYLSTPFGLHSADYRARGYGKLYAKIVAALIANGVLVRVTDYNKLFLKEEEYVKKSFREIYRGFRQVICDEMKLGPQPDAIITIGKESLASLIPSCGHSEWSLIKKAVPFFKTVFNGNVEGGRSIPLYAFVHPSNVDRFPCFVKQLKNKGYSSRTYILDSLPEITKELYKDISAK